MVKLAREIVIAIVTDFGADEMLRRLSHPYWFQAFGCILGYDWHSNGVTTTLCGALKERIKGLASDLGLFIAGGKDGIPYPVDHKTYDQSIDLLRKAINRTKLGLSEKREAFYRLNRVRK